MQYKTKPMSLEIYDKKVDLLIERDSGNKVLILMGKPEYSLPSWKRLRTLCNKAIKHIEGL